MDTANGRFDLHGFFLLLQLAIFSNFLSTIIYADTVPLKMFKTVRVEIFEGVLISCVSWSTTVHKIINDLYSK